MSNYCSIKNKLSGNVIDFQGASMKAGALLDAFSQKTTDNDNQLWEWILDPAGSDYCFIRSKLNGNVIDVQGPSMNAGTPLTHIHRRRPTTPTNAGRSSRIPRTQATTSSRAC